MWIIRYLLANCMPGLLHSAQRDAITGIEYRQIRGKRADTWQQYLLELHTDPVIEIGLGQEDWPRFVARFDGETSVASKLELTRQDQTLQPATCTFDSRSP